jgi:hypothetical protein
LDWEGTIIEGSIAIGTIRGPTGPTGSTGPGELYYGLCANIPLSPDHGDRWFDLTSGRLFTWYKETGITGQWVQLY